MEHGGGANPGTEVLGVRCNRQQRVGCGAEQQVVDRCLVLGRVGGVVTGPTPHSAGRANLAGSAVIAGFCPLQNPPCGVTAAGSSGKTGGGAIICTKADG